MKLDTISFNADGQEIIKAVTNECEVVDINNEIEAITQQLEDFRAGVDAQTPEDITAIQNAIVNYEEQLIILNTLAN